MDTALIINIDESEMLQERISRMPDPSRVKLRSVVPNSVAPQRAVPTEEIAP